METAFDPNYIEARETLRAAGAALEPHSNAVILVGAQAVYVHTESADESFAVAPFTYDADIALDPGLLEDSPALVAAMSRAGFRNCTTHRGCISGTAGARSTCWCPRPWVAPAAGEPGAAATATRQPGRSTDSRASS